VTTVRILGVCGSLQARSGNRALLDVAMSAAPEGVDVVAFDGLRAIPPFDPDADEAGAPEPVQAWRRALAGSDAVLVASPEYGFSLPGTLKNSIDWVIGSGELEGKIVAITAAVKGEGRGRRGLDGEALGALYAKGAERRVVLDGPVVAENVFEDGDWAILEWRDAHGRRGCTFFRVKRGEIVEERGIRSV
jgi:hypothetical protein